MCSEKRISTWKWEDGEEDGLEPLMWEENNGKARKLKKVIFLK